VGVLAWHLGLAVMAASLLWAAHLATSFLVLGQRAAWFVTAWVAAAALAATFVPSAGGLPPEKTAVASAIIAFAGIAQLLHDLALLSRVWRKDVSDKDEQLRIERRAAQLRSIAFRSTSHELRTPLTTITGFASLLADTEWEVTETERRQYAEQIADESRHLTRIVEDLLAAARMDADELRYDIRELDIEVIVRTVSSRFVLKGLELECDLSGGRWVMADPDRLEQIMRNIFSNADKYGGSRMWVRTETTADGVAIDLWDDGPGVPPGEEERIFGDFVQVGTAGQHTGSGLGLGIARRLARAMNGDLVCVPTEDGSRFRLTLPAFTDIRLHHTA
jgi:signal transduction histidine kinase